MDFKQVQELIKIINKSNIGELTIEEKEFKITIKQKEDTVQQFVTTPTHVSIPASTVSTAPSTATSTTPVIKEKEPVKVSTADTSNLITIKSPMIGTFYRKSSPDKPLFVEVGDDVSKGKVVCIIEAMKLFNEIESEVNGKIVKVLVDDSSPVEYDQPLFLVEPA